MIKTEVITEKKTIRKVLCDICGKDAYQPYTSNKCEFCGRDICPEHKIDSPFDSGGDYGEYICPICEEISKDSVEAIKDLEEQIENIMFNIRKDCNE